MNEKGTEKEVVMREVKLEELVEVVTSYRCRFCEHTCSQIEDMTAHLQKTHVITSSSKPTEEQEAVSQNLEPDLKSDIEPDLVCEEDVQSENRETFDSSAFMSNLGLVSNACPSSPNLMVTPALPDPKVLTNQVRSVAKNLSIIGSSQAELGLFSLAANARTHSLPLTGLQLTDPSFTLGTTTNTISVSFTETTKDLGTGPASIAPITRELFLCGVCSVGFISMDECKYHMEREHNTPVESVNVSDTVVNKYDHRVSVGTQATGKRPGRKRKSEIPPPSSSLQQLSKTVNHEDNDDEDWFPGRSLSSGNRDGRQRRKIRTPRALKEDYVIEKKRRYRKRRTGMKESYIMACSYLGCATKFRNQESLDIHLDTHNKEDDAFTCIHCNAAFEVWKPLRIHLWRSHNIDCDMFQCDVCEYKTDTLHKLGVHREIHSDNRPYTCDVCGKGFKQLSQMKNHQIIHAEHQRSGRETWFSNKTCEVCKRTFANSKCLKKHVEAVHGQHKPFKCQYCNHTTAWKAMLILHERTHTGEKPFKCDVCHYATGDHNSLRRHKMRHTGQRQYKCQLCSYTCIQTISLKTHMHNKHPNAEGIVYMCQLCKFRTINKQIYDNHMEDHRNGLIPDNIKVDMTSTREPLLAVSVGSVISDGAVQFQLQVKRMETGELHANKEDIDKLNSIPELVNSGMDANQIIYSALNIGSHAEGLTYTAQLLNGVQFTVSPSLPTGKDVVSSYLITFCASQGIAAQASATSQTAYQSLSEQDVAVNQDESSEPSSQDVEPDTEAILTLSEVSQSQNVDQVTQLLYSEGPQIIEETNSIEDEHTLSGEQSASFQVMPVSSSDSDSSPDGNMVEKEPDNFNSSGAVEESQAGHIVDGIEEVMLAAGSHGIMVMGRGQEVERMLDMGQDDVDNVCDPANAEVEDQSGVEGYPVEQVTVKQEVCNNQEQS